MAARLRALHAHVAAAPATASRDGREAGRNEPPISSVAATRRVAHSTVGARDGGDGPRAVPAAASAAAPPRDPEYELREVEPDEFDQLAALNTYVFGKPATEPVVAWLRSIQPGWRTTMGAFVVAAGEDDAAATDRQELACTSTAWNFTMRANGSSLALGAIAGVGTHPDHRRKGLLRAIITAQFAAMRRAGQCCALLWASQAAIYKRYGFAMATESRSYTIDSVDIGFADGDGGSALVQQRPAQEPGTAAAMAEVWREFIHDRTGYFERDHLRPPTWGLDEQARLAVATGWAEEGGGPLHADPSRVVYCAFAWDRTTGRMTGYCVFTLSDMFSRDHPSRSQELQVRELVCTLPHQPIV